MADVQKWFSGVIANLRELGIRKPGELLQHLGGPEGVMEVLKNETELRIAVLRGAVDAKVVANPKFKLSSATNSLEVALANEDISPGRIEEALTPSEQARICSNEQNWNYIMGRWIGKEAASEPVEALASMITLAVTHGLATFDDVIGRVRPILGLHLPREEFQKLIDMGEKEHLTNELLYHTLDLKEVVRHLPRKHVADIICAFADANGIKRCSRARSEESGRISTTDASGAFAMLTSGPELTDADVVVEEVSEDEQSAIQGAVDAGSDDTKEALAEIQRLSVGPVAAAPSAEGSGSRPPPLAPHLRKSGEVR